MTNRLATLLIAGLAACAVQADDPVLSVSIDEIRENPTILEDATFVSTGQPDAAILETVKDAGFVAVIDLRTDAEERGLDEPAAVAAAGLDYVSIPVAGASGVTFENAQRLDEALAMYEGPVFLHCRSGNRVGALMALRASAAGKSDDVAVAEGKAAGLGSLEPVVVQRLKDQ